MDPSRRTVIAAGTAFTALLAAGACRKIEETEGAPVDPAAEPKEGLMEIIHIYADEQGVSHVKRVEVTGMPKPLPVAAVVANAIAPGVEDWHTAPRKTFTINTAGDIEAEVSDGSKVAIGKGDLVYLEDREGKGHITRLLTPVSNLFLQMDDDFDFEAWAASASEMQDAFGRETEG
ncbi:MAG TPA: hypothetical protein VLA37_07690 [Sphingomonadaceae bacterium]|nr:hypothetical protein [Sphingomonadaceae bacterium]